MIKVLVRPSVIILTPYRLHQVYALEKMLAVWDPQANRYTSFLYEFEAEDEKKDPKLGLLKLPRGLGLETVKAALEVICEEYTVIDQTSRYKNYSKISKMDMVFPPKDEVQEESCKFLNNTLYYNNQAFLQLDVGKGKTYCSTKHICDVKKTTMVISFNLANQWSNKISEYTNLENGENGGIVNVVGIQYFEDCVSGKINPKAAVYLTTINTLHLYQKTHGKMSLQDIADCLGIGIKIFDEAHNRYLLFNSIDLNMQTDETIYLSATPGRSAKVEDKMFAKIYKEVKSYGSYTAQMNNYYIIRYVTYNSNSTAEDRVGFKTPRGLSSLKYTRYLFDKYGGNLMRTVMYYAEPIFKENPKAKMLIVTDWIQDIEFIRDWLKKKYPNYSVGTYCGLVKDKELKEKELTKQIIIGTIGSMQNGKDIEGLQMLFPLTTFSSSIVTRQLLGRLRQIKDKDVYYFDFADISVPSIMDQRRDRDRVFRLRAANEIENDRIDLDRI